MKKMIAALLGLLAVPALASAAVSPWKWVNPLPQGNGFNGAAAVGSEVYAVGEAGTVVRYDGSSWSLMSFPWKSPLRGVWGSSASALFVVGGDPDPISDGGIYRYDGSSWSLTEITGFDLYSVWGAAADDVYAGGDGGKVLYYNGYSWVDRSPPGLTYTVRGIWGASSSDIYAVAGPYILKFTGSDWFTMTDLGPGGDLRGIWGTSLSDIFAVRPGGKAYHYNGSEWTVSTFGDGSSQYDLHGVWGTASNDVYVAGGFIDARVYRWDGAAWADLSVPYKRFLYAVAGAAGRVHVFGDNGAIRSWDGSAWERVNRYNDDYRLTGIWGSSASDVYATGGYDPWTPNEYGVGVSYPVLHFDGSSWSSFTLPEMSTAVWGSGPSDVFVGGAAGSIFHYAGAGWSAMTQIGYQSIKALWGSGPSDVFAAGDDSYPYYHISHYSGAEWAVMTRVPDSSFESLWGSSGTDVFAGAVQGQIYHYDGTAWELMTDTSLYNAYLWGSSGSNVYAVGGDHILHYDGSSWSAVAPGVQYDNYAGIWGAAADDIYVVNQRTGSGDQVWGRVHRFDGSSWVDTGIPCENSLGCVWGSSGTDVYVGGDYGALLRYRGGAFSTPTPVSTPPATPVPTPTPGPAAAPWVNDYDGDGTSDIAIFRPASGMWSVRDLTRAYLGNSTDDLVPADYDGDGTTDLAIFRENGGLWSVRNLSRFYLGSTDDRPVPGDYDGDGAAEAGIFRPSSGLWSIRNLTRVYLGSSDDAVVPGWYDDDTAKDIAVFRGETGMWSVRNLTRFYFGSSTDDLVPGDYAGAGFWEAGIFRPSSSMWSIRNVTRIYLGSSGDWALPADYDGDGIDDAAIFRDSAGLWSVRNLTRVYFGSTDDIPVTR